MKARMFSLFGLAVGLALLLTLAVAVQQAEVKGANQAIPNAVSVDLTSTPGFTTYLPVVFKDYTCTTAPTLISPTNGSNLSTLIPLFQWDSGNNPSATLFVMAVARDSEITQIVRGVVCGSAQGTGQVRFSGNFEPATTYYWRAWLKCGDLQGPYSEVWSFTTGSGGTILSAPTLIAPANGSTVPSTSVTVQWSAVSGAVEYLVSWRPVGVPGGCLRWASDTNTTISSLSPKTTYEWWVSARNDYAIGADSETWQFTTPAGSSSISHPDLDGNCVVEEGGVSIVFEGQDNRW